MYQDQSGKFYVEIELRLQYQRLQLFFFRWTWLSIGIDEIPFLKVNSNCFHVSVTLHTLNSIQDVFHMTSTILNLKH